jgi:hypothetical protein
MEELVLLIGGAIVGAGAWVVGNLFGAVGYALTMLLLVPLIFAGVLLAGFVGNLRRRMRGEPIKPFRWR